MAEQKKNSIPMQAVEVGRKTVWHLQKMKDEGKKISMVGTAYLDPMFTMMCEKGGVDLVRYTCPGENSAMRAENIKWWTRMQRKMAPNICLNAVMQTQQYADPVTAVKEASEILADGADSVMPMGVTNEVLKAMTDNHIAVYGHVGCLSGWQTARFGGYRRVGKTAEDAMNIFRQAYEYQELGMCGMTIEMTNKEVSTAIAKKLRIPVIQVAAGGDCDGAEMVIFDLLGMMPPEMMAGHAKVYATVLSDVIKGCATYNQEVKENIYPGPEVGWSMDEAELDKFMNELESKY
ncbi:MAG: 3-methyl-2-oxobutanoate hydroxymethyltransferase [Eubacteriales bacterium]|nr:3-methyl-2-oxobutanoate hydroxymethyltransferase [Eubacteriales bacterium]